MIFTAGFAIWGVLNTTVWLHGARPANTCIPPSFLGNVPMQLCSIPTPKIYVCKFIKISVGTIIYTAGFAGQGFSKRTLLFGYSELDLPTPVFHLSSLGTRPCSHAAYPPQKVCLQVCKNGCLEL
jgi:hypothetical protein